MAINYTMCFVLINCKDIPRNQIVKSQRSMAEFLSKGNYLEIGDDVNTMVFQGANGNEGDCQGVYLYLGDKLIGGDFFEAAIVA
jgi:hypothetical protein